MFNDFIYYQPVKIHFGVDKIMHLNEILCSLNANKAVLICDPFFKQYGENLQADNDKIVGLFCDVQPNPILDGVMSCTKLIEETGADAVIALGGGSSIDTAKYASACAYSEHSVIEHFGGDLFTTNKVKIIAVPTTAGTGSEVTQVSVISHGEEKKTTNHPVFMPSACIVDPKIMLSVPKNVTMQTGLDAMAHALEGYWSKNHLPITDLFAIESVRLILENLQEAYEVGSLESRTNMAYASLLAGMTFALPKTAGCHACSYPLSAIYHLSHGEACAFTLDSFVRYNKDERLEELAKAVGVSSCDELADKISYFKSLAKMKTKISELEPAVDLDKLAFEGATHPLMQNNPVEFSTEKLRGLFEKLV